MMLAYIQLAALIYTVYKLTSFDSSGYRYKVLPSFIASCWGGFATALALATILDFESVPYTFPAALVSALLAIWCGGNVAELGRKISRQFS